MRILSATVALLASLLFVAEPASAQVLWEGDPAKGTRVFGNLECARPGSIVTARQDEGFVAWRYTKKKAEAGQKSVVRCETRGIRTDAGRFRFRNNSTYYLGWSSKLSTTTAGDYTIFQWKSYCDNGAPGNGAQNYPVIMKIKEGHARLFFVGVGETWNLIWTGQVEPWKWYRFVVGIHTSNKLRGGWVEFYFNGEQQRLGKDGVLRYPGRTLDTYNEPKWGIYDRQRPELEAVHRIYRMKVGTTYNDVR
ncbi:Polysaccharide lyase [Streptoalloteichus tenebrarius]|uniref:Polysaccharide lyase n=1 Tax=Streptoalloteichus tenebrarius (strain ATCC 17920 / DSM 40477 / JCM 4838 / CBS 697.72 / NBRC 16177 / NCIMB 11028 / NRRL B-12390 / A12253. 1 / ISP 5477) TaxID=1933 RepID=A0ABT1HPQ1_STRSD|nr:heparin lyase I family protein [Streptoalloteichus tenebrarius]MCP2257486.1 Polysaccharide lyase [Streptoalloteichus tenebrarius]BFE98435.1 heparin lyase I family protein [Streptoalloteichus tenebrarius]